MLIPDQATAGQTCPNPGRSLLSIPSLCLFGWLILVGLTGVAPVIAQQPAFQRGVVIELRGPITPQLEQYLYRKLKVAERERADLIILEIDSPGGLVETTFQITERLRELDPHVVAWVPREALSGAAILALGCDEIVMAPTAVMGDAGPIFQGPDALFRHASEKIRSHIARKVRDLASEHGRPPALAEAMVDMNLIVYRVRHRQTQVETFMADHEIQSSENPDDWEKQQAVIESREGSFLEVNGVRAVELGLAEHQFTDRMELVRHYQLPQNPVVLKEEFVDRAVTMLNHPIITGVLFLVAFAALYVELSAPGIGIGGVLSALCFTLFFWSRFLAGTAGTLELILFFAGLAFLALEFFVIPGFGISGISGLVLLVASLVLASQATVIPSTRQALMDLGSSLGVLMLALFAFIPIAALITRHFGKLPILNRLILAPAPAGEPAQAGLKSSTRKEPANEHPSGVGVGDWGVAHSTLRPAGKCLFADQFLDVVADGDFIEPGTQVRIVKIAGNRIVVRRVDHPAS